MAKAETNVKLLNSIRESASAEYKNRVPVATLSNLADVGNPILSYSPIRNEFLELLVNKIALPIIRARRFRNPLAMIQREGSPLAYDEEEIAVNPATAQQFNATSTDLLSQTPPDVKVAYHRLNRQEKYPVTIQFAVMRGGFTSWSGFDRMNEEIIQSIYNGNYIDEFEYTKATIASGVLDNTMYTETITLPTDETTAKAFIKKARQTFTNFSFPSTQYNSWARSGGAGAAFKSWSNPGEIMLFLRSDLTAEVDVEVLARAFNIQYADFMGKVVIVDNFGTETGADKICAVLCDREFPVVINKLFDVEDFRNGSNLSTNYWLHVWQTYSTSPLKNACAFVTE